MALYGSQNLLSFLHGVSSVIILGFEYASYDINIIWILIQNVNDQKLITRRKISHILQNDEFKLKKENQTFGEIFMGIYNRYVIFCQ